jgi:ABC-type lipoprotein release transport system permease subunit
MSLLAVVFFLARRSLFESRLTMALLIAAVAAGTGFQVPNSANMAGYESELLEEGVESWLGDIRVRPLRDPSFEDGDALAAKISAYPRVRAVLPILTLPGAIGKEGRFIGAPVIGIPTDKDRRPFRLIDGKLPELGDKTSVVVGSSLAKRLGVKMGDTVRLRVVLSTSPTLFPEESVGRYTMHIRGIAGGSFGSIESMYVDRSFLAYEAGTPGAASILVVHIDDHFAAQGVAARIAADLPAASVRAWMVDSEYLQSTLSAAKAVGAVSQAMVVAAVTIPVLALLYINVLHRRREVGVLSALGFRQAEIFAAFLLQALLIGVIGTLLGCGLGYGLVRYFQAHPIFEWEGFVIRPVLSAECFARPSLVVLATTLIAGVYPAWRASRIDPARVLRGLT